MLLHQGRSLVGALLVTPDLTDGHSQGDTEQLQWGIVNSTMTTVDIEGGLLEVIGGNPLKAWPSYRLHAPDKSPVGEASDRLHVDNFCWATQP